MRRSLLVAIALLVGVSGALYGQAQFTLNSINPTETTAGGPAFTMALVFSNMPGGSVLRGVLFDGTLISATLVAPGQVTAQVPTGLILSRGTVNVALSVQFLSGGIASSTTLPFTINAAPAITTPSAMPAGLVGGPYYLQLSTTGGTQPLTWSWSGTTPSGLTLNSGTGEISGTAATASSYSFTVQVTDFRGSSATKSFTLNIAQSGSTQGPDGQVGVPYPKLTLYAQAGTAPYTWTITLGALPPGLTLNTATGEISQFGDIPTTAGEFHFWAVWTDSFETTGFPTEFIIRILAAPLTIRTNPPLPNATAGTFYSQTFAVDGGLSPYTWSFTGTLPPGLTLSSAGVLSGTPTQGGPFNFTVRVSDASGSFATKAFSLTVTVPAAPTASVAITDPSAIGPAQQPTFDVELNAAYPLTITGTVTLTFIPNAVNAANDPAIQFSGGGRTLNFTITAGQTRAFPTALPSVQTGTVAGQIDMTVSYSAGGQNITPAPAPLRSVTIARAAPKISTVQVVRVTGGFNVLVTGYSTPRQVTQAVFTFTPAAGANLQTTQVTVPVDSTFTTWYTGTSSPQFGSSFLYTQPFTVQGNVSDIASVSVAISNATGTSTAVSASF